MNGLEEFETAIAACDRLLIPIAGTPVDISDPEWMTKLRHLAHPLDRVGIRAEAEDLLSQVVERYAHGDAHVRQLLRSWFEQYRAFAWAASPPWPATTADGFRLQLLHFSVLDQGPDTRDAILWLQDIVSK